MDQRRFEVLGVGILFASFGCALVSVFGLPEAIRGWQPGRDGRGRDPKDDG